MRTVLHIMIAVLVLAVCNGLIWQKETVLRDGKVMLLRLAPRDPRSLMQGDYMVLNYEAADRLQGLTTGRRGAAVMHVDERGVATLVRVHAGEPLGPGEALLQFRSGKDIRFGAESFFFQEGTAGVYDPARYGELRVAKDGVSVLVGLRDEHLTPLGRR